MKVKREFLSFFFKLCFATELNTPECGLSSRFKKAPLTDVKTKHPRTSLLLVLFSAPRGFSPGTPVFPSPQKPTFPNSNSSLESVSN